MRRVEELTQRRLGETGDVAELWMALRALPLCHFEPDGPLNAQGADT
jgi:hypothetical protein